MVRSEEMERHNRINASRPHNGGFGSLAQKENFERSPHLPPRSASPYYARSASDRTDDWPYWYVADRERAGLNVTVKLRPEMRGYMPFLPRWAAEKLAELANRPSPPSKEGE